MSIAQVRSILEKPGCGITAGIVLALTMGLTMFSTCQNSAQMEQMQGGQRVSDRGVLQVGKTSITEQQIQGVIEQSISQQKQQMEQFAQEGQPSDGMSLQDEITTTAQALGSILKSARLLSVAEDYQLTIDDASIQSEFVKELDRSIVGVRQQLVSMGKLKDGATEAEFEKAYSEAAGGETIAGAKQKQLDEIADALKDPRRRFNLLISAASLKLRTRIAQDISVTDKEVEEGFDTFKIKAIRFGAKPGLKGTPVELARQAKAEIEKGLSFEKAMEKYSVDQAMPGKKLTEQTIDVPRSAMLQNPTFKTLTSLKVGMNSEVIETPGGPTLFKVQAIDRKMPDDYAKRKEFYKEQYVFQIAAKKIDDLVKEKEKNKVGEWTDPGYAAMASVGEKMFSFDATQDPVKAMKDIVAGLPKEGEAARSPMVHYARFLAFQTIWGQSKPEQKKDLREDYIAALNGVAELGRSASIRLMLVEQLIEMKDDKAAEALLRATEDNTTYGPIGAAHNSQITQYAERLKKDKMISPELVAQIEKAQGEWITTRNEIIKAKAEAKKAREEQEKQLEEERKKNEAERAKAKAEAEQGGAAAKPDADKGNSGAGLMTPPSGN